MKRLCVDPGTRELGWAIYSGTGLVRCGLLRAKSMQEMLGLLRYCPSMLEGVDEVVCELPQHYGLGSKADPNKLQQLSVLAGAVVGITRAPAYRLPHPREWKGQVPKEIMRSRAERELSKREQAVVVLGLAGAPKSVHHNVWDAVEIGLWATKRI